jgi:hypothetical protein
MSGMPGSSPSPMQMSAPTPPPNATMNNGPTSSLSMNALTAKRLAGDSNEVLDKKRLQVSMLANLISS